MLSERKLKKYRKKALVLRIGTKEDMLVQELTGQILDLTQELLDQHLIRKENEKT